MLIRVTFSTRKGLKAGESLYFYNAARLRNMLFSRASRDHSDAVKYFEAVSSISCTRRFLPALRRPLRASFPHIAIKMKTAFPRAFWNKRRFSLLCGDHIYFNPIAGCCPTHIAWKNLARATSIFRFDVSLPFAYSKSF